MKVLAIAYNKNPYPFEIYDYLNKHTDCQVEMDMYKFWCPELYDFDIIHIHWPEVLTTEINRDRLFLPQRVIKSEAYLLLEVLKKWQKKAKVITTVHNLTSHTGHMKFLDNIYRIVFQKSDVLIHLGQESITLLNEKYGADICQVNYVIPHNWNEIYPNTISAKEARKNLNISQKDKVILVFGDIRTAEEKSFVLDVFNAVKNSNKRLLIARWKTDLSKSNWRNRLEMFQLKIKRVSIGKVNKFIDDAEVQVFMNASDLVICPRNESLNSGLIGLAANFATPIVGPAIGNIGEVLEESGGMTFEPSNVKDAANTIDKLLANNEAKVNGEKLYIYAKANWSIERVAKMHLSKYQDVLKKTTRNDG
jgi:beta-1,4-mannosyltransferase